MAAVADYLADTSALTRVWRPEVAARIEPLIMAGRVATCTIVDLEILYSARSARDYEATRADRAYAYPLVPIEQPVLDRAVKVQASLARAGQHRGATLPDLLIAAAAERAGLTLLHYDADFELIAGVTGQPVEWVVERGSVA